MHAAGTTEQFDDLGGVASNPRTPPNPPRRRRRERAVRPGRGRRRAPAREGRGRMPAPHTLDVGHARAKRQACSLAEPSLAGRDVLALAGGAARGDAAADDASSCVTWRSQGPGRHAGVVAPVVHDVAGGAPRGDVAGRGRVALGGYFGARAGRSPDAWPATSGLEGVSRSSRRAWRSDRGRRAHRWAAQGFAAHHDVRDAWCALVVAAAAIGEAARFMGICRGGETDARRRREWHGTRRR